VSDLDEALPSAIVLAGGASRRFGSDKLAVDVGGLPLLHRAIAALAGLTAEIVVVAGAGTPPALPKGIAVPLRLVQDDEPGAGPLAAVATGLAEAASDTVLIVGGDMPTLVPAVLALLVAHIRDGRADAAALRDGVDVRPLPLAVRRRTALSVARELRAEGQASLRRLVAALDADAVPEQEWRPLDPVGATLADIDTQADLEVQARRRATMFNRT